MSDIEREAFERAMNGEAEFRWLSGAKQYVSAITQKMWETWQAARQAPGSGEVEPVVWLVKFKEYEGRFEFAEPYEKATNHEYWTDAFPVYTHPPAKVPEAFILRKQAEAVDEVNRRLTTLSEEASALMDSRLVIQYCASVAGEEAQRLRQQAAESEK